jgi:hypothetical protein
MKTYEFYNDSKNTIVINGYKMSNIPIYLDTIINKPVEKYDYSYDDYYENGEYYGEGWWKVDKTKDGGYVLFNPKGNEIVEINHKSNKNLGVILNNFIINNSRKH